MKCRDFNFLEYEKKLIYLIKTSDLSLKSAISFFVKLEPGFDNFDKFCRFKRLLTFFSHYIYFADLNILNNYSTIFNMCNRQITMIKQSHSHAVAFDEVPVQNNKAIC